MAKWIRIALVLIVAWIALSVAFKILSAVVHLVVIAAIIFIAYTLVRRWGAGPRPR
jgi:hypothetical protein